MHGVIHLSPNRLQRFDAFLDRLDGHRSQADAIGRGIARSVRRLPSWCWPLLVAAATWPSGVWAVHRLLDDSDDPLGFVALATLLLALWRDRDRFAAAPRVGRLIAATLLVVVSDLPVDGLPDLARALLASVAIVLALAAIADRTEAIAPYAGLAVLALPLLSSLQFYAGFPLRVVTAEASRWLLTMAGSEVARVGSALMVDGHLILVDAPCSGVRLAWVGYFTACVAAWMCGASNRRFLATMPLVGATVLTGNIVRNTVLVAADAHGVAMTDAMHSAVGLVAFAGIASIIGSLFVRGRARTVRVVSMPGTGSSDASAWLICVLAGAAALPLAKPAASEAPRRRDVEWPTRYDGRPIRPLALSAVERRFAAQFPGTIARFAYASGTIVMRDVERPTRRLHPAADCYRGLGYSIAAERLERVEHDDAGQARLWRCFRATRGVDGLTVCERIVDRDGVAFTDASSWYWAASLGRSHGPWRAVTIATPSSTADRP